VSRERLQIFASNLRQQGLELQDVSSEGMSCLIRAVMTQAPSSSMSAPQHVRQLVAEKLEERLEQEQQQGGQGEWTAAILGLYRYSTDEQQEVLAEHLRGVRAAAMLCDPDMAALAAVVHEQHGIQLQLYSPLFAGPRHRYTYTGSTTASNTIVHIAHVDAAWLEAYKTGAQQPEHCQLNHFVVVRPTRPEGDSGLLTGGVVGGQHDINTDKHAVGAVGPAGATHSSCNNVYDLGIWIMGFWLG